MEENFYGPEEDTYMFYHFLENRVKNKYINPKKSLEIGVGSGKLSYLLGKHSSKSHTGVDINPYAIAETKKVAKGNYFESDLFSKVKGKFDLIIFNPPYLPSNKNDEDNWITKAIVGGKNGYELIITFIDSLSKHLKIDGKCYILFSSLSKPFIIIDYLKQNLFEYELCEEKSFMMERLYIYEITKSKLLIHLEKKFTNISYVAQGKHGFVYKAKYKKNILNKLNTDQEKNSFNKLLSEKIIVGIKIQKSLDSSVISNEFEKLLFVNTLGIGPKVRELNKIHQYLVYDFFEGYHLRDLLRDVNFETEKTIENTTKTLTLNRKNVISRNLIIDILIELLKKCEILDKAGFEKKEFTRPYKNVLINTDKKKLKVQLIDFERGIFSEKPSNIAQLIQFFSNYFLQDKDEWRNLALEYSKNKQSGILYTKLLSYKRVK